MPSFSASTTVSSLLPQAAKETARARPSSETMRARSFTTAAMLSGGHGDPRAPVVVLLEDRPEPPQATVGLALQPRAGERLDDPVGRQGGLGVDLEVDARLLAGGLLERVGRERPDAVELARAADLDDAARPVDLGHRHVRPVEAVERRVDLEPRARAPADRVLARQAPVLEVVVGELGVVRD